MPKGRIVWGITLLIAGALEAYGIANPGSNDTLSEFTRWAFHVDSGAGQAIFLAVWGSFSAWFAWHILTFMKKKDKKK